MKSKQVFKHRMRTLLFLSLLFGLEAIGQNPQPQEGLVAHYPLSAEHWNKTSHTVDQYMYLHAYDVSGNGHHGTYTTGNMYKVGKAPEVSGATINPFNVAEFKVNGKSISCTEEKPVETLVHPEEDPYLQIPEDVSLNLKPVNGFSIAFWMYWSANDTRTETILSLKFLQVLREGENIKIYNSNQSTSFPCYTAEGWYYNFITYFPNTVKLYKYLLPAPNFIPPSIPYPSPQANTIILVDGNFHGNPSIFGTQNSPFEGKLSQVKFFNKALSQTEVDENFQIDLDWVQGNYSGKQYPYSGVYSYYPFEGSGDDRFHDVTTRVNHGTKSGTITTVTGHDGTNNAIKLEGKNTRVNLGNFFGKDPDPGKRYDPTQGFTFSFWTKIEVPNQPFSTANPSTVAGKTIFFANKMVNNKDTTILGMQRLNELLASFRYSPKSENVWKLWYNEPISFTNQPGWYQVIFSCHPDYSEIFVYKPQADSYPYANERLAKYVVNFGSKDQEWLKDLTSTLTYGIGSPSGSMDPIDYLDDFRIYNWPLSLEEVKALTSPEEGTNQSQPQTFAFIADYGCDGGIPVSSSDDVVTPPLHNPVEKVANMVKSWQPDFITTGGDNNYSTSQNRHCSISINDNVGKYYGDYINQDITKNRFYPAFGNHDDNCPPNNQPANACKYIWENYFPTEQLNINNGNDGRYYTFTKGTTSSGAPLIQFFVINSNVDEPHGNAVNSTQYNWVQQQMQYSVANFQIVIMHHPPVYSTFTGQNGQTNSNIMAQWPLKDWGADMVLSGDTHWYERNEKEGVVYITCGASGVPLLNKAENIVAGNQKRVEGRYGAMHMQAYDDGIWFRFYAIDNLHPDDRSKDQLLDEYYLPVKMSSPSSLIENPPALAQASVIETSITVFPNPTNGELTVRLQSAKETSANITIFDVSGKLVFTQRESLAKGTQTVHLGDLKSSGVAKGIYFLQVNTGDEIKTVKVVMQ